MLWFAWKFVPLWYQQQPTLGGALDMRSCDLLENSYLCGISNNSSLSSLTYSLLWFAWKFVPLWYQQQHAKRPDYHPGVVICLKIRTFVVSATTLLSKTFPWLRLWFAWKFVPLWYQQQPVVKSENIFVSCDLLENSYLCGISNNHERQEADQNHVVICLKIRTFVVSATTVSCLTLASS